MAAAAAAGKGSKEREMNEHDDAVMANLIQTMSTTIVMIKAGNNWYDGIVLASKPDSAYVVAHSEIRKHRNIWVKLTSSDRRFAIKPEDIDFSSPDNGLVGIRCVGSDFGSLVGVDFCELDVQEQEIVYTYVDHSEYKALTRGSIILLENGSFDHNCSALNESCYGAPVFNRHQQLVGICYEYNGYLSSYNMTAVATKIENNQRRVFTTIAAAFDNLRH